MLEQLYKYAERSKRKKQVVEQRRLDTLAKAFWAIKRKW